METLISMGIVSIGIVGLFSLVPVAVQQASNGIISDRKSALGQNAVAEFMARGLHRPERWVAESQFMPQPGQSFAIGDATTGFAFAPGAHQAFAIDPQVTSRFPAITQFPAAGPPAVTMPRISVRRFATGAPASNTAMNVAMADFLCTGKDDQVYDDNPDDTLPPLPQMATQGLRQTEGAYTWMATIAPRLDVGTPVNANIKQHTLSLVVFYNRDLADGEEHVVNVAAPGHFYSGGIGGGDMLVTGNTPDDVEHIEKGSWVMLSATAGVTLHRWYRVIDVAGEIDTSGMNPTREITLDGPDWPYAAAPQLQTPQVTVVDGVVAVYERTIRFEDTTLWAD